MFPGKACGQCRFCLAGQYSRCVELNAPEQRFTEGWRRGFAEYIKRKSIACYKLRDHVSWQEGALVEPLAVGVHGVRRASMRGGDTRPWLQVASKCNSRRDVAPGSDLCRRGKDHDKINSDFLSRIITRDFTILVYYSAIN